MKKNLLIVFALLVSLFGATFAQTATPAVVETTNPYPTCTINYPQGPFALRGFFDPKRGREHGLQTYLGAYPMTSPSAMFGEGQQGYGLRLEIYGGAKTAPNNPLGERFVTKFARRSTAEAPTFYYTTFRVKTNRAVSDPDLSQENWRQNFLVSHNGANFSYIQRNGVTTDSTLTMRPAKSGLYIELGKDTTICKNYGDQSHCIPAGETSWNFIKWARIDGDEVESEPFVVVTRMPLAYTAAIAIDTVHSGADTDPYSSFELFMEDCWIDADESIPMLNSGDRTIIRHSLFEMWQVHLSAKVGGRNFWIEIPETGQMIQLKDARVGSRIQKISRNNSADIYDRLFLAAMDIGMSVPNGVSGTLNTTQFSVQQVSGQFDPIFFRSPGERGNPGRNIVTGATTLGGLADVLRNTLNAQGDPDNIRDLIQYQVFDKLYAR